MRLPIKTLNNERPDTSDVVLCDHCGVTLHAPEEDVFWHDNLTHCRENMYVARIEALELERDSLRRERDDMRSLMLNTAKNMLKSLT